MADSSVDLTESRSSEIITIASVFTGIATATVGLKIFARARIDVHTVGWDDFFIFLSLVFSILAAFLVSYSAHMGFGRHTAAVLAEPDGAKLSLKIAFYQMIGYPNQPAFNIGSFSFPNISIAILVNNLLDPNLWRTRALFMLVTLQIMFAFLSVLILFLMCRPVEYLWDKSLGGSCWSASVMNNFSYWLSAYTAFTDIVLAIIPIVAFWKLQMRLRIKLGVCIMMGLTFISAIFTIIKATYLWLLFGAEDPLYELPTLVIWGLLEQNIVIVAACIPTLQPFFHEAFKGHKASQGDAQYISSTPTISTYFRNRSNKHTRSVSELPLEDMRSGYARSSGSHDDGSQIPEPREESSAKGGGIMRTLAVSMEWDDNRQDRDCMRDDRIVLAHLR
ncbi:putative Integral membrane protein [Seiridium unicorne]|uniref:Integral membrane protein n=1 Tax=Seiridium unicorne TaxID=138068 RepID=A0ABR2V1J3_9PEZI